MGLSKLQAYMENQADYALNSLQALHLAEGQLEYFRTRSELGTDGTIAYAALSSSSTSTVVSGANHVDYSVSWTINNAAVTDVKQVTVTTSWQDRRNQTQQVVLKTMLSKYSEFDN